MEDTSQAGISMSPTRGDFRFSGSTPGYGPGSRRFWYLADGLFVDVGAADHDGDRRQGLQRTDRVWMNDGEIFAVFEWRAMYKRSSPPQVLLSSPVAGVPDQHLLRSA